MLSVKRIEIILSAKDSANSENYAMDNFNAKKAEFTKFHAQAKDFVKFLTTLERQFKNIGRGDLKGIEETLPSLLNGLKLIWTISRHINQNETKFENILEAISNEICTKVRVKIDIATIFKTDPRDAIGVIRQGASLLKTWRDEFEHTKSAIETEQTIKRWDFGRKKEIFLGPEYMGRILSNFENCFIVIQEFYAILGKDLKTVVGKADIIDSVTTRVKEQVNKLENFENDVYSSEFEMSWETAYSQFQETVENLEQETAGIIDHTFENRLNSSEGAFDLLAKFKNVKTRKAIEQCF
jgi:dynein heavy chain